MNEEEKNLIIQSLNLRIGGDINELGGTYELENELIAKRDRLQSSLNIANNEVPTKLSSALVKAELNSKQIEDLKARSEEIKAKVKTFLNKTEPFRIELDKRFAAINKLEEVLVYLKSFEKIDDLSKQMKQTNDDEQMVLLYGELKKMCGEYQKGHRATYVKEYTHYWHNVLKDRLTKSYEDALKLLKWPFTHDTEHSPPPKEVLVKFHCLTKYLFLIEEPEENNDSNVSNEFVQEKGPCLPVRVLLRPLKKRFQFHFTGSRQTARIDRPEWFLTQTLTWIKDHQSFVKINVQPIADKLELKNVKTVDEFNTGLIALAAERLHTVLAMYHTQSSKGEIVDVDAAFAHAVDETLGFHRELVTVAGKDGDCVLSVLTKAETFVRWLAVEKKYALAKMDESLCSSQWSEAVGAGATATGTALWAPRAADWFVSLLRTIEQRYAVLPQPGHRLQFLELQLELVEEWRVRLTQIMSAAVETLNEDSFLSADSTSHPLTAVINAAQHTRIVLLQWAHSLHYLQLHYYRRQFQHFTQQQHHDEESSSSSSSDDDSDDKQSNKNNSKESKFLEAVSLQEVEIRAQTLALNDLSRRNSVIPEPELNYFDVTTPIANLAVTAPLEGENETEEAGVFSEAPALLSRLRDAGLASLAEHILMEFKAGLKDYKRTAWHSLLIVEELALSVSSSLCRPLSSLCARLSVATSRLAPQLAIKLRALLAQLVDAYIFEEVVLESWFNTGGTMQFTHDVRRNLVPAFAPPNKIASHVNQLPKLNEACKLLNMDYEDARRLRCLLKQPSTPVESLLNFGVVYIPPQLAFQILNQRTDLSESSPTSVMELF